MCLPTEPRSLVSMRLAFFLRSVLTMVIMMRLLRLVNGENNADWCYWDYPMIELYGKTAGIIGLGRIGQATAKLLNALDMKVLAYDAYQSEAGAKLAEYVSLDELFAQSDVIFLHCPLFPATEGIINKENIAKMKDGVILINNSRGQLVVEQDLADALNSGKGIRSRT